MAPRDKVMAALEQACRAEVTNPWVRDLMARTTCDEHCVRYGAATPSIAMMVLDIHMPCAIRRVLDAEFKAGRVLKHQSRDRGLIRWWPVGLWETLQAEQAGAA